MINTVTNNKIKIEIEIDAEEWKWFRANCAHFKGPNEEEQEAYVLGLLEKAALKTIFEHKIYLAQQQIKENSDLKVPPPFHYNGREQARLSAGDNGRCRLNVSSSWSRW